MESLLEMGEKSSDLGSLCRTCMSNRAKMNFGTTTVQRSIYEKPTGRNEGPTIVELLQSIQPQIQIHIDDKLPKNICPDCIEQLQMSYEFMQMYKDADERFRKLLNVVDTIDTLLVDNSNGPGNTTMFVEGKKEHVEHDADKSPIVKGEVDKVQSDLTNNEALDQHPEFEAMFIHNRSDGENDDAIELSDNPFGNASDDDDEWTSIEASKRKTMPQTSKNKTNKTSKHKMPKRNKEKQIVLDLPPQKPPPPNEDSSITCQRCKKVLTNVTLWQEHMLDHSSLKVPKKRGRNNGNPKHFKCENCGKVFQRRSVYNTHMLTHTGNFRCLECGKRCKSYDSLKTHMLCHKGERFECENCGKEFSNLSDYNNHVLTHKADQPLQCKECGKILKTSLGLSTHMLRHRGEKNFQCPHCPRKFVVRSGLYGHVKQQHEEGNPFLCDICGKGFRMADMLTKHKRYHSDRNYPCEYCDKRFVTAEKQRRHMRTHTGEKPYRCKYCDRAYSQSSECNKHMKQHLGENIFQCELCPLRFPLVRDVRAHFVSHKDDDEETRDRNLEARALEQKILTIKFGRS